MDSVGVNVIETAALGRPFQLGMLYDCRKDALIPGITLWDPEKLQQSLRVRPQINTNFKVMASDSIEDKSSLLNIDGSLKLSVLGGLINVTGSAEYLKDTKKSFKQQRLTLRYHSTCRVEELTMNHLASEKIVHHEVLDKDTATHVVTAVLYGADACFVFDREVSSDEEISTVKGEAKVALEKLKIISVDVNVNLKMDDTQKNAVQKFTCSFYGDFQLPSNPTSFEDALQVFSDLPNLLGENQKLAVPLRVWLYPLDKLHSGASKLQKDISMDLIMAIESVIESLNTTEMKCNDLLKDSPASTFAEFHDKILQIKQNCNMCKLRLMNKLGFLLPNIRGDVMKETDLNNLLQEHDESPFRGRDLAEWLKERERESDIIKSVLRQLKDAGAQIGVDIDLISMDLDVGNLVCYTFTSLNWSDVLLPKQKAHLSMSAKGETGENSLDSEQKSWLTPEIHKTTRNNLKIFKNLIDSKDRKSSKFIVSSKEMKNNPGSCILLYESECDEAVCFIPPSQPACPITEEVKDNSVVLKVPPSCPATVELRLLYKPKKETVWRSKPVMKDELTVTLTDLRAGTEYEIKCAALGKLNYTVYSDVISVTTEEGSLITEQEAMNTIPKVTQSLITVDDMRNQTKLMMQPYANWEEYLTPAPLCIAILGELVFISSSTDFSININTLKDGYKFIKYPDSFRACLMQVCNSVWFAFNEARNNMYQIYLYTTQVPDDMKKAVHSLFQCDDEVVKAHLPDQLDNIRVIADECLELSDATEKRFTNVINVIQELLEGVIHLEYTHPTQRKTTIEMLVKVMDVMGRVKNQLEKTVNFFQMVSSIVKTGLSKTLTNFVSTSEKMQNLSYNSKLFSKDLLYIQAFQVCNIASLAHMISGTYTEMSSKYLMHSVRSLDKLMTMDKTKPEFEHERQHFQNGCDEAQKGILRCVFKNKEEFERKSTERIEKIDRELLATLPAAPPEITSYLSKTIQAGFSEEEEASYY